MGVDYKQKIVERWGGATRTERSESIQKWLDEQYPGWRENFSGNIPAEMVLIEAIGDKAYGRWDIETSEEAEEFVMDYYIGDT